MKNLHAVALARRRMKTMTAKRRKEIASMAGRARWDKEKGVLSKSIVAASVPVIRDDNDRITAELKEE
jgi:hypothetical protein